MLSKPKNAWRKSELYKECPLLSTLSYPFGKKSISPVFLPFSFNWPYFSSLSVSFIAFFTLGGGEKIDLFFHEMPEQ